MGLGFSYFFNLVFLWVILSWEVAEFSCYSSVSLGRRKKNKTHTSCLIEPLKRAIKHWWHAPSVRHICLKTEAKWDWYLPKHLAGKELFALLDRETVPSMWRVRISYINAWDFSFHMWPNVLFFFFFISSSSRSIIFLFVRDKFTKILCCSFYSGQWSSSSHWGNLHTVFTDYTECIGSLLLKIHTKYLFCVNIWNSRKNHC